MTTYRETSLLPAVGTARFNGPAGRPLTIVSEVVPFQGAGHGSIAVLTDGEEWYSAEVVFDGTLARGHRFIAYAVNGYAARSEAERDALQRRT